MSDNLRAVEPEAGPRCRRCGENRHHMDHDPAYQFSYHPFVPAATAASNPERAGKFPIDRPCSACSAGDYEMEHHDHQPPFREAATPSPAPDQQFMSAGKFYKKVMIRGPLRDFITAEVGLTTPEYTRKRVFEFAEAYAQELFNEKRHECRCWCGRECGCGCHDGLFDQVGAPSPAVSRDDVHKDCIPVSRVKVGGDIFEANRNEHILHLQTELDYLNRAERAEARVEELERGPAVSQPPEPTVADAERLIKKMELCENMAVKIILLKNFMLKWTAASQPPQEEKK